MKVSELFRKYPKNPVFRSFQLPIIRTDSCGPWHLEQSRFDCSYKEIRKAAKIRNRYNQVPHLTQDTIWDGEKNTNITNKSLEVGPFLAGDHRAAMNRHESVTNTRHKAQGLPKSNDAAFPMHQEEKETTKKQTT